MAGKYNNRVVIFSKLPFGTWCLEKAHLCRLNPTLSYKICIFAFTFITYTIYHMGRKVFGVVEVVLCPQCTTNTSAQNYSGPPGWAPFDIGKNTRLGYVDYSWLFSYAMALYFSGMIADRVNLRYYLVVGILGSVVNLLLLGIAYYAEIHHIAYFIIVQIFGGVTQATGLPAVVAIIGHLFGKQRRGLILGLWTNTRDPPWGLCFIVPAIITFVWAIIIFLFMVVDPVHVGLEPPNHHWEEVQANQEKAIITKDGCPKPLTETQISTPNETEFTSPKETDETSEPPTFIVNQRHCSTSSTAKMMIKEPVNQIIQEKKAIGFLKALMIPLVSYTFLFWLPLYVKRSLGWEGQKSALISSLFDVGGIAGGILTGLLSDILHARAFSCSITLLLAIPSLFLLRFVGGYHIGLYTFFLLVCGFFVDGTYAMITTVISSDLGTHVSLKNDQTAKATVTSIIDATGSLGAAFGPLIVGLVPVRTSLTR